MLRRASRRVSLPRSRARADPVLPTVSADTFTTSGTVETVIGCGWANGAGAYWNHADVDYYAIASVQSALPVAQIHAAWKYLKTRHTF